MLKCAIIGLGNMGKNHLRVCEENKDVEIIYVCDVNIDVNEYKKYICIKNYKEIKDVDFVIIATPSNTHYIIAKYFLDNKIKVLIEKPVCLSLKDATVLSEYNIKDICVSHTERYNVAIQKMKEILETELLGDIISFNFKRVGFYPPQIAESIILDIGIHDIDNVRYLFGNPNEIFCISNKYCENREDSSISLLKIGNVYGTIENSWITPYKLRTLNIIGKNATANIDLIKFSIIIQTKNYNMDVNIDLKEPLKSQLEHFIDCIKNDKIPNVNILEATESLKFTLDTIKSCREDKIIKY